MNFIEVPFRLLGQIGPRLIMIAAMVTSYKTQHELFLSWGVEGLTAAVAPAVIDLLAITCAEILHDQWVIRGKASAGFVLVLAGLGSMAANWIAGVSAGSKVVHASMVLAYVLAELVVGRVRRATEHAEVAAQAATPEPVVADDAASPDLPTAPVSPAPAGTATATPAVKPGRPSIPAKKGPAGKMVHAETGAPLAARTEQRKRKLAEAPE